MGGSSSSIRRGAAVCRPVTEMRRLLENVKLPLDQYRLGHHCDKAWDTVRDTGGDYVSGLPRDVISP